MSDAATPQGQAPAAPAPAKPVSQDMRGVPETVARVAALLAAEKEPQTPAPATQAAAQEQVPAQPEATPEAEAPAAPNTQVEGEDAPAEDARKVAEIPIDQLEAIELETTYKGEDGKDITEKLPVKTLREGYMRQKDYQRKTAEVARQKEAQAEIVRQAVESERNGYQKSLSEMNDLLIQTAAAELKDVNWDALAKDNPFEFVRLTNEKDKFLRALTAVQAKQKEVSDKQKSEQAAARQKLAAKARDELQEGIPGWNDGLYQTLMKSGEKYGYKPEEVATWVDPRAIKLLHKAYQFDQLQAEKTAPAADKRVVVAPKAVRPGTPANVSQRQQQEQGAMKQLQASGKITDAAAVIRSRFG